MFNKHEGRRNLRLRLVDGVYYPEILCDYCGGKLTARDGNACWLGELEVADVYYVHKACTRDMDDIFGQRMYTANLTSHLVKLFLAGFPGVDTLKDAKRVFSDVVDSMANEL